MNHLYPEEVAAVLAADSPDVRVECLDKLCLRYQARLVTKDLRISQLEQENHMAKTCARGFLEKNVEVWASDLHGGIKELKRRVQEKAQKINELSNENNKLKGRIRSLENDNQQLRETNKSLKSKLNAKSRQSEPAIKVVEPPRFIVSKNPEEPIVLHFDGGSQKNNPPYGMGYGSYKINDEPIVRMQFEDMSANAAEVLTALRGLIAIQHATSGVYSVHVTGDSKIALGWINAAFNRNQKKISPTASPRFKSAVEELRRHMESNFRIKQCKVIWRPRKFSVAAFGH